VRTDDLIHDLAEQGRRVRLTPHYVVRFTGWAAASVFWVALGVAVLGLRSDLAVEWHSGLFLLQAALAFCLAAASAGLALVLSVPGDLNRPYALVPVALLLAWAVLLVGAILSAGHVDSGEGLHCVRNIMVLALVPEFLLYIILRAAAPLRGRFIGFLAGLGASSLACLATSFVCRVDDPLHLLVWHFLPILSLSAFSALIGRSAFANDR